MVNKNRMYIFKGGTWSQSSNFYLKWSFFFTIAQNRINKKLQELICKPQLAYFVYLFVCMTSQLNHSKLLNFISARKKVKIP